MPLFLHRRLVPLFAAVFVCLPGPGPAHASVVEPDVVETGSVIVTAETAEVREGPSRSFEVITVVEKGEIFSKQGRTRGWYCIRINDDTLGWVSGRAISRYREGSPSEESDRTEIRVYPTYPGLYYDSYWWGWPYFSWEWYLYDRSWPPYRPWIYDKVPPPRDWYKKRPGELPDGSKQRPRGDFRDRSRENPGDGRGRDDWERGKDPGPGGGFGPRNNPESRSPGPQFRGPVK